MNQNTNLLERYLQAVRFFLPRKHRDDIIRELEDDLIAEMDDRSEELGRPLDEDEQVEILRGRGHPMITAGRYQSPRQLIGPAFFPLYIFVLRMGLYAVLVVGLAIALVNTALHGDLARQLIGEFSALPARALLVFAWTTLGFAALDGARARFRFAHCWDPRRLPKLIAPEDRLSRAEALVAALFTAAAVGWLLFLPGRPALALGPAAPYLQAAPIWSVVYWPLVLLTCAETALVLVDFARPYRSLKRSVARLALDIAGLVVFLATLSAGQWILAQPAAVLPNGGSAEPFARLVDWNVGVALGIACLIAAVKVVRGALRLKTRRDNSLSPGATPPLAAR